MKRDIRAALFEAMGKSPVIPLGDGSWRPTVPPWTESRGPLLLYADGGQWFSHRAFSTRDSLLGPLYLVVTEVLEPHELATTFMLSFHMDTRCMLYLEKGETLELLPGIPRSYLEAGKQIDLKEVVSYFGPFSLHVESHLDADRIEAAVAFLTDRRPTRIELRLPHPQGRKAAWVSSPAITLSRAAPILVRPDIHCRVHDPRIAIERHRDFIGVDA